VTFGEELVTVMLPEEVIGEPVIDMPVPPTRVTLVTVPVLFVNPLGFVAAYAPISASVHATLAEPLNVLPVLPIVNVLAFCNVVAVPALPVIVVIVQVLLALKSNAVPLIVSVLVVGTGV
jgi:hypothetical protein